MASYSMIMATKRYQLDNYRKALLNRVTANAAFTEYVENCLAREDEAAKHSFHKIMIHNWSGSDIELLDTLSEYFTSTIIPIMYTPQPVITFFYTSSLSLVLRMIRMDFMFPYQRNMFNVDILFNDKNSTDCFHNTMTIEDIVCGVVSGRINEKFELDLSNFCNDSDFVENKVHFYKLSLLSHFKILMLRMGRDTKALNLSKNNLSQVPLDILNFFIKGPLTSINLSDNNIPSLQELLRVSSKIEKLWLEGNPLCEALDATEYVKTMSMKFPRLLELDGVKINQHGCTFPFFKNYLVTPDRRTKMMVEKFLTLYFSHFDSKPRRKIDMLYDTQAKLTINTDFTEAEEKELPSYASHSRNAVDPKKRSLVVFGNKTYRSRNACMGAYENLPDTVHDPSTFTVDVLHHDTKSMILVVDGIYKDKRSTEINGSSNNNLDKPHRYFQFRKTFVFGITVVRNSSRYYIHNEMFSVRFATQEQIDNSFKNPVRNMNELALVNPDAEDIAAVTKTFMHVTGLKKSEAEARLRLQNWDIRKALKMFIPEYRAHKVGQDKMEEDDDFSDLSSLGDEID